METLPTKTVDSITIESQGNDFENQTNVDIDETQFDDPQYKKTTNKRKKSKDEDELMDIFKKRVTAREQRKRKGEDDSLRMFLLSLLPEISKVVTERQLKLGSDILAVIGAAQAPFAPLKNKPIPYFNYQHFNPMQPQYPYPMPNTYGNHNIQQQNAFTLNIPQTPINLVHSKLPTLQILLHANSPVNNQNQHSPPQIHSRRSTISSPETMISPSGTSDSENFTELSSWTH